VDRPHVVVHVAVALNGASTGFSADVGRYYEVVSTWQEDVTLTGADTVLAQEAAVRAAPHPGPTAGAPLLAVIDGRGRVTAWEALRAAGYWSDVLAVHCRTTPARSPARAVEELVAGDERVDLTAMLRALGQRPGVEVVRVDSGGRLTGALLERGLVDEVSLLVHPCWTSACDRPWYGSAPPAEFELVHVEALDRLAWLRYRVAH
jgi:2,5-diamino-6-(ribosylamino)-4(3H)-pyrimidinone 5'-phosphate reductase